MPWGKTSSGFTLVELMVIVAILGIFASIAVPSFTDLVRRNRLQSASEEFYGLLQYARTEAVSRGRSITVTQKDGTWLVKTKDKVLRQQRFTAIDLQVSRDTLTFRQNGTADAALTIAVCAQSTPALVRTLSVENSGRVSLSSKTQEKKACATS
ncbi:type II secretion system protein GspH [Pseudomonas sp. PIC25]|uniref:GspH/FimT family pseudopilin n=1 Tax=Pseudomonas sp. PIC25 TaxID=1958773 RepID=UPI000BAB808E|nr:GspH/FimT family pseudopilin [Pseudomonas sp. PIC25]PAU66313.1 type II secretion system protein GspH [Pseudomonas sp. PIC25]